MTDVQTTEASTETSESKRTRYTGPVDLVEVGVEEVDLTTTGVGRGRPTIDLKPYEDVLRKNFAKNANKPPEKKVANVYTVNTEAVGTVKSRFGSAAANLDVGLTWSTTDNEDGTTTLKVVAGKRAVGRGRKPGHNNQ